MVVVNIILTLFGLKLNLQNRSYSNVFVTAERPNIYIKGVLICGHLFAVKQTQAAFISSVSSFTRSLFVLFVL